MAEKKILVGVVIGAHGVRGELKLRSFTETPTAIVDYPELQDAKGKRWKLALRAIMKDHLVVLAEGVADRNRAETLKGTEFFVPRSALPEVEDEGAFYIEDLVGLRVIHTDGSPFGEVVGVHNYGASDILEILVAATGKKDMFAFTEATFPALDMTASSITICPPEIVE